MEKFAWAQRFYFILFYFFELRDIFSIEVIAEQYVILTFEPWERHGCVVSTVATDALVLKHQAISIHDVYLTFIILDRFQIKILHLQWTILENKITLWKNMTQFSKG